MLNEKVLSSKPIALAKVKEILKDLSKEGELTYEQSLTLKYVDKFSKITRAKAEKLIEDLMKFDGMTEEFAIKIADVLPQNEEVLFLITGKNPKISEEENKKMLELIKSVYTAEKKETKETKETKKESKKEAKTKKEK